MVPHPFILSLRDLPFSNECRITVPQREVDGYLQQVCWHLNIYMLVLTPQPLEFIDISWDVYQVMMSPRLVCNGRFSRIGWLERASSVEWGPMIFCRSQVASSSRTATVNMDMNVNRSVVRNQAYCSAKVEKNVWCQLLLCDKIIDYLSINSWVDGADFKFDKPYVSCDTVSVAKENDE